MLYPAAIRHPRRAITGGLLVTLATIPGLLRLQLRTDGNALVPEGAPAVEHDRVVRQTFGTKDQVVVVIETSQPEGIYNQHTLLLVHDLTRQFARIDGVSTNDIVSLATERTYRYRPGSFTYVPILAPLTGELPSEPDGNRIGTEPTVRVEPLQQIRTDVEKADLYIGTLVSHDRRAAAILIGVEQKQNRKHIYEKLKTAIDALPDHAERIYVAGAPVAESLLGTYLLTDLEQLIPISAMLMAGVFFLIFRGSWSVLLPVSEVAACLVFVFGIMGYTGVPVYLTMAVLPVILTAMGVADEVHIFNHYRQQVRINAGFRAATVVTATMQGTWRPVLKTSVTTAIGFLSFSLSTLKPVRSFGIFVALGILFCLIWSLVVIPAALTLVHANRAATVRYRATRPRLGPLEGVLLQVSVWLAEHRWVVASLACTVALAATWCLRTVYVQDSWVDGFPKSSDFYRASTRTDKLFCGTHLLLIDVRIDAEPMTGRVSRSDLGPHDVRIPRGEIDDPTSLVGMDFKLTLGGKNTFKIEAARTEGDAIHLSFERGSRELPACWDARLADTYEYLLGRDLDGFLSAERLRRMYAFERFIAEHAHVGGVLGTAAYVTAVRKMKGFSDHRAHNFPDDPRVIRTEFDYYRKFRGAHQLRQIIDRRYRHALFTVFLEDADYRSTASLLAAIREYEEREFLPRGERLGFAGDIAVSQAMIEAIVRSQTTSLVLTLAAVTLITILLNRSVRWGLCCVIPPAFAVLINFGLMGLLNVPLGVATSMFAAMTIGLGVDYAIHLTERWRSCHGRQPRQTLADSMAWTGRAISADALAIGAGFAVLLLSEVPANERLGLLMVAGVGTSWLATVLGLPAIAQLMGLSLGEQPRRPTQPC